MTGPWDPFDWVAVAWAWLVAAVAILRSDWLALSAAVVLLITLARLYIQTRESA